MFYNREHGSMDNLNIIHSKKEYASSPKMGRVKIKGNWYSARNDEYYFPPHSNHCHVPDHVDPSRDYHIRLPRVEIHHSTNGDPLPPLTSRRLHELRISETNSSRHTGPQSHIPYPEKKHLEKENLNTLAVLPPLHASSSSPSLNAEFHWQKTGKSSSYGSQFKQKLQDSGKSHNKNAKPRWKNDKSGQGSSLLHYVNDNIIGRDKVIHGPFGPRKSVYCDYVASGRALQFIEDFIEEHVLPSYGNTHTTSTNYATQTTMFRAEARSIIKKSVNANNEDVCIFTGSGCTGAVHKLITALNLQLSPIVFCGPFEHHSNLLPWREIGELIIIDENDDGLIDLKHLEDELQTHSKSGRPLIGSFGASSNVTGLMIEIDKITALLHRYGALSFWDYATAAPYVDIDMNPVVKGGDAPYVYKDAVFISTHKFIGGVQTPGILVAKASLFNNPVPTQCGGGTVLYVTKAKHFYLEDIESREEGGTPAIVESIRAGLVFQLKDAITSHVIMQREQQLFNKALPQWKKIPGLDILGPTHVERIPIFSLMFRHVASGYFLHYKYIATLLNDVFGIQTRGGCACAGPYGQELLGINEDIADEITDLLDVKGEILKPGFVRLNLPYFMEDASIDFVIQAIKLVAENAWKMLPQYEYNESTNEWCHISQHKSTDTEQLSHISYAGGHMTYTGPPITSKGELPKDHQACLSAASKYFAACSKTKFKKDGLPRDMGFDKRSDNIRWFLTPKEAYLCLHHPNKAKQMKWRKLPFQPKKYPVQNLNGKKI